MSVFGEPITSTSIAVTSISHMTTAMQTAQIVGKEKQIPVITRQISEHKAKAKEMFFFIAMIVKLNSLAVSSVRN